VLEAPEVNWEKHPGVWEKAVELWKSGLNATNIVRELKIEGLTRSILNARLWRQGYRRPKGYSHSEINAKAMSKRRAALQAAQSSSAEPNYPTTVPASRPVLFLKREAGECRWIVGGEGIHSFCCGAPAPGRRSYCEDHHRIAHTSSGTET
jgi:hypothetical protein